MNAEERARLDAHEEAMRRYGPVPDYTSLPYEQVIAFERGASWQRTRVHALGARINAMSNHDADRDRLRRVWAALGCEQNPNDFRESVREQMWGQALDMIRQSTARDNRVYRENQRLEAEIQRLRAEPDEREQS